MTPIERQAEDIVRAMVSQSWNEEIETIAALLRDLEAARKVADAAVGATIAGNAKWKVAPDDDDWRGNQAYVLLAHAESDAADAFRAAVREYRERVEGVE